MKEMEMGDKYIFKNTKGEEKQRTWIGSVLDWARYNNQNVFCPRSGFSLIDAGRIDGLWGNLTTREQKLVYYSLGIPLHQVQFWSSPIHYKGITYADPSSMGQTMLEMDRHFKSTMPEEVLSDLTENTDVITEEYSPDW